MKQETWKSKFEKESEYYSFVNPNYDNQIFESMEVQLLEYLLKFRSMYLTKIGNVEKLSCNNSNDRLIKNEKYQNLNKICLCDKDQVIQSMLEQEFEKQKLGYYNYLGMEVKSEFLTIENKYRFYRFQSYKKRLEFVENLIKELDAK